MDRLRIMEIHIVAGLIAGVIVGSMECLMRELKTRVKVSELLEEATSGETGNSGD